MKHHNRTKDELLLMQFVEDQGFDLPELMEAVERLKTCHKEKLQDYGTFTEDKDYDYDTCSCDNQKFGLNCSCEHERSFPGNSEYSCEFCGIYKSFKPQCNKCELG